MKSVKLPDEMVNEIKNYIITNEAFGYETITEFVRAAVRHKLLECLPTRIKPTIEELEKKAVESMPLVIFSNF